MYFNMIFVLIVGSKLTISSKGADINVGQISAMLTYGVQILMSLMMLSMIYVMITISLESMKRICEVLNEKPNLNNPENPITSVKDGSIDFNNVSFKYNKDAKRFALENINLNIESGMTLDLKLNISLTDAGSLTLSDIMEDIDSFVTYTVKKDGVDITKKCTLIFDTFEHTPSYYVPLRVEHREIGLSSATAAKVDNGEALFNSSVFISSGSLADGEVMEASAIGYIDYVGTVKNEIYPAISIVNSQGEDVQKNYVINFDNIGTLTIIDKDE